jgi:hypothetical protein
MVRTVSRGQSWVLWPAGLAALLGVVPAQAQGPQPPQTVVLTPQMPPAPPAPPGGYGYPQGQPAPYPGYAPQPQGNFPPPQPPPAMSSPGAPSQQLFNQYQTIPVQTRTVIVAGPQSGPFPPPLPLDGNALAPQGTMLPPAVAAPGIPGPNAAMPGPVINNLAETLPMRIPTASHVPPLPALPPGATMGGFPAAADVYADLDNPLEPLKRLMTVTLRDGGVLRPYGFFRGDLDFATNHFNDIQYPLFVFPSDPHFKSGPAGVPGSGHDFNYSLYPYLTRLGLEYYGQPIDGCYGIIPSGRLEFDFLSNNTPGFESRDTIRLRLAYVQLQYREWTLVVGQDWDIIAPLLPTINDNTYLWDAGNLGGFRPQVKLLWDHDLGQGYSVQVQNGIALADVFNRADRDGNGFTDNQDSGVPSYQGRVGLLMPSAVAGQKILFSGWCFWLLDRTREPIAGRELFPGWGSGLDLRVPLTNSLTFQGEFFHGKNMDDYRGGIGQGVNPVTGQTIASTGGWAELVYRPVRWWQGSAGFSIDAPDRGEVPVGGRTRNYVWYFGNRFPVGHNVTFGTDYMRYTTDYNGFAHGSASLIKFFCQLVF